MPSSTGHLLVLDGDLGYSARTCGQSARESWMAGYARGGRRREILETFTRHVAERGYDRANFGDVATELGMSKGTIVHHFGTKDRMLAEVQERYMGRRLDEAHAFLARLAAPEQRIAAFVHAGVRYSTLEPAT